MRIRPRSAQSGLSRGLRERMREWTRSHRGFVPSVSAIVLCVALAIMAWTWYRYEGQAVVDPFVRRLLPRTSTQANDLPTILLDIEGDAYRALSAQRARALRRGMLSTDAANWQSAQIRFQNETIPVRVVLGGHQADHWQEHKWSLRVQTQDDTTVLGMHRFVLQSPATCGYLSSWLYTQDLLRAGILVPRRTFVNVSVNGETWGMYALVEGVSKTFPSDQGREEGAIVHVANRSLSADPMAPAFAVPLFAELDAFAAPSAQDTAARELVRGLQNRDLAASQAFDVELAGRYLALTDLWGTGPAQAWHDESYYYNPSTKRLEPIGSTTYPPDPAVAPFAGPARHDDPAIMAAYVREALRISQPAYLEALRNAYHDELERYADALAPEFFPAYLEIPWEALADRQFKLSGSLQPQQTVHAYQDQKTQSVVSIRVANILPYPVVLQQLQMGKRTTEIKFDWIAEDDRAWLYEASMPSIVLRAVPAAVPRYVTLHVPIAILQELAQDAPAVSETLQIVTYVIGLDEKVIVDVEQVTDLSSSTLPALPSLEQALARHPFLKESEQPGFLELRPGTWHVAGDLLLPHGFGLWATQAVTLTFDRRAVFLATGPLLLYGPDEDGIHLYPADVDWGGLVVWESQSAGSTLQNVEIRATTGAQGDGPTRGGITFYKSPVRLDRCRVFGSTASRAVYIVGADFELVDTKVGYASLDAFGGDLVRGRIERSTFHDILGNGIDLTESEVTIGSTNLLRIYGQGVLAGRGSLVSARGLWADDVGFVIGGKDMSSVNAQNVHVHRAWVAGFAAYSEELAHGPTNIRASQVVFGDDSVQALVRDGGSITIDGSAPTMGAQRSELWQPRRHAAMDTRVMDYSFGAAIRLVGYDLLTPELVPGERLQLILYWQALAKLGRDYTVFVHLVDQAGQIVAQWDAMPRENTFPTTAWPVGEIVDDPRQVPLPADLAAGTYQIALGLYYVPTVERLPARGPNGEHLANAVAFLDRRVQTR